jgi:hypothetical protein
MKKMYLALLILVILLVGSYAALFAYAKFIVIPEQLKHSKEDLKNMNMDLNSSSKVNTPIDFGNVDLTMLPASERKNIADQMRSNPNQRINTINKLSSMDSPIAQLYIWLYYLVFEFDAAEDMKEMVIYQTQVENTINQLQDFMGTKLPDDIEKGDTKAVTADNTKINELLKEIQKLNIIARDHTQKFVKDLGG